MKRCALLILITIVLTGCPEDGQDIQPLPETTTDVRTITDTPTIDAVPTPETVANTESTAPELTADLEPDAPFVECEPGTGCFLDPCSDNTDCLSGFCVEHMGAAVCSQTCSEECPPGWTCKLVTESEPDVLYICVSDYSNLCKPCSISSDCKSYGGADDVCVSYGGEGSFCGGSCDFDADCPWGFGCKQVTTVDGVELTQCYAEAGVCPCTPESVEKGLFTPCQVANDWGVCSGKRVCVEDGLTSCDAMIPALEECNGLDDDCDDEVDEPVLAEGKYIEQCDDGNNCTDDSCSGEAGCVNESLSQGECVDGDACTIGDHCEDGVCLGLPIACDDDNPCTDDECDGMGGCSATFNNAPCDDEEPCTVADTCNQGECQGYAVECDCQTNDDCAALEDGNLCNGILFCDKGKLPYECAVQPDTVVVCPEPLDGSSICTKTDCTPETGACFQSPDHEGYACDDDDPCTVGDKCESGQCQAGVPATCNDANECTTDICMPGQGCQHLNNTSVCSDGDVCTTNDVCADGECIGGPTLKCDDGNQCTLDTCDPLVGCAHGPQAGECDDGNACTKGDHCANGKCVPDGGVDCNDDNPCTQETCSPLTGCSYQVVGGACNDDDPCTINDHCVNGVCASGAVLTCDDDNACTADSCSDSGLCVHAPQEGDCDDGDACTTGDHCDNGSCVAADMKSCDDDNPCTLDSCLPGSGCKNTNTTAPCSDGDPCTINDVCADGACGPGPQQDCDDGNDCTDDSCGAEGLCIHAHNQGECDDENECTVGEKCLDGQCSGGQAMACDDEDICTTDTCDAVLGCVHSLNTAPCNDQNVCTTGDQCQLGACSSSGELNCNDGNPCTDDSCDAQAGCEFVPNNAGCNDQNVCTEDDVCANGMCTGGNPADCDDDNPCTDDLCDVVASCMHFDNNVICNDLDACTANEFCSGGECGGGVPIVCDDKDMCTDDSCDPNQGCVFDNNTAPCSDANECTDGDQCDDGKCAPGGPTDCDDSNVCTDDSCDTDDGCQHDPVQDETPCGQKLWCKAGQCVPTLQCPAAGTNKVILTSSGTWNVPGDVEHVRVMVVGGGGGGAKGHGNGAGSGHVRKGEYDLNPCDSIQITIGTGGTYNNNGQPSKFGNLLTANHGTAGQQNSSGSGAGGSGGGGAGNSGCGGDGGSCGSSGQNGCTYSAGAGGNFDTITGGYFKHANMSCGAGGAKGTSSHAGGGGGGGALIDGQGTGGGDGAASWSAKGGKGYGGGGGGGGYNGPYADGGTGGKGVVYIEWD